MTAKMMIVTLRSGGGEGGGGGELHDFCVWPNDILFSIPWRETSYVLINVFLCIFKKIISPKMKENDTINI